MANVFRKRYWIDARVQGAFVFRIFCYWLGCAVFATFALILWRFFFGPARPFWTHFDDLWFHYSTGYIFWVVLLPVFIFDFLQMSNRFAGPVFRLRNAMRNLVANETREHLKFRKGDFWGEVADEYNAVVDHVARVEGELAACRAELEEARRGETVGV